jgi:hypothetical protein
MGRVEASSWAIACSLLSVLAVAQLEQGELLNVRVAAPACMRRRTSLWSEGCRMACVSEVQQRLDVEPGLHI